MKTKIKYSNKEAATFIINIKWRESYEQTQYVNKRVAQIIDELDIRNKTNYEKVQNTNV